MGSGLRHEAAGEGWLGGGAGWRCSATAARGVASWWRKRMTRAADPVTGRHEGGGSGDGEARGSGSGGDVRAADPATGSARGGGSSDGCGGGNSIRRRIHRSQVPAPPSSPSPAVTTPSPFLRSGTRGVVEAAAGLCNGSGEAEAVEAGGARQQRRRGGGGGGRQGSAAAALRQIRRWWFSSATSRMTTATSSRVRQRRRRVRLGQRRPADFCDDDVL